MIPRYLLGRKVSSGVSWTSDSPVLVFDGNSIAAGSHINGGSFGAEAASMVAALSPYPPFYGNTAISNVAIGGQTLENMIANHADMDSWNRYGASNFACLLEGTNSAGYGDSGLTMFNLLGDYIADIRSVHGWHILVITTPPNWAASATVGNAARNAAIDDFNARILHDGASIGIDYVADIRAAGSPFNITDYNDVTLFDAANFNGNPLFSLDDGPNVRVHLTGAGGFAYMFGIISQTLEKLQPLVLPAPGFGTYARPFAADSPWNSRPDPVGLTLGTYVLPSTPYDAYIGGGPYSVTRFLADPSDPPQVVYGNGGPGTGSLQDTDAENYIESITVPHFPPSVIGAAGADGHADITDVALNRVYSFYQMTQHGSEFWAQGFSWTALDGRGWGDPAHYMQGARATGVSTGGGIIPFDFVDGDHYPFALAMSLDGNAISPVTPGYVFPATNADYDYLSRTGTIPEGALLMLPQDFPEFTPIPSSDGVNERLNKIIRTLKLYGARLIDRNTDTRFVIYVEGTSDRWIYPSGYTTTIANQMNAMANALRVATPTGFIDGYGNAIQLPKKLNMLSLRPGGGTGYDLVTGTTKGTYDTFTQSVTFASDGVSTTMKTPDIQFPYQATWCTPNLGDSVTLRVTATGGAKLQLELFNSFPQFNSGLLGNGQSATFSWPTSGIGVLAKRITLASGPTGGGTVKATLIAD